MEANEDAWELWQNSATQWRTGFNGPVGLDYGAVSLVADILGIPLTVRTFRKLQAMERRALEGSVEGSALDN